MAAFGSNLISRLTVSVLAPVEVTMTVYVAKGHVLLPQVVVVTDAISSAPAIGLSTPATRTKKAIGAIANVSRRVSLFMGLSNVVSQACNSRSNATGTNDDRMPFKSRVICLLESPLCAIFSAVLDVCRKFHNFSPQFAFDVKRAGSPEKNRLDTKKADRFPSARLFY